MTAKKTYTEDELNEMLEAQATRLRLNQFDKELGNIEQALKNHIKKSSEASAEILTAVNQAGKDRRDGETDLKKHMYDTFVKKSDLKTYLFLIVATVTAMSGIMAWVVSTAKEVVG